MVKVMIARCLCCTLVVLLLACCGTGDTWVDQIDITLREDETGQVRFSVVQSLESVDKIRSQGKEPFINYINNEWVKPCQIATTTYNTADGTGFQGLINIKDRSDLEYIFSCIPVLSDRRVIDPYSLKIDRGVFQDTYDFRIDLSPGLVRQIRVTLPGNVEVPQIDQANTSLLTVSRIDSSTIQWTIARPNKSASTVSEEMQQPGTTQVPSDEGLQRISLVARSHQSKIDRELVFSVLGLVFGSGVIWQILQRRRKNSL